MIAQQLLQLDTHPEFCYLPSLTRQGEKIGRKNEWVKINIDRLLTIYHKGQNKLSLGKFMEFIVK